jgi:hypothetical protein
VLAHLALVNKLVALAFRETTRAFQILGAAAGRVPRFAAVIRALDDLGRTSRSSVTRKCGSNRRANL